MMKKLVLLVPVLMLVSISLWAQQRTVSGEVVDYTTNQPVIGATIVATGTQTGTASNAEGEFSLQIPSETKSLTVSYVGYDTKTVPLDTSSTYTIPLQVKEHSLNQLVVVGYGTQKKADLTGAVSTVDVEKTFESKPIMNTGKALQGVVPGLTFVYGNGGLTAAPDIKLRGVGSLNGNSAPLILVDNVPTPDLSVINPLDIASITVLKDAASAAIYGARAAFGVVLIKTKYGHRNRPTRIRYTDNFSWNTPTVLPDFADPVKGLEGLIKGSHRAGNNTPEVFGMELEKLKAGIANWEQKYANNRNGIEMVEGEDFEFGDPRSNPPYFYRVWDVKKQMIKKWTPQQMHNLTVSGGSEKVGYYLSAGYNHKGGIMKINPDDIKKYNISASVDVAATKWLDVRAKMLYRNFEYDYPYEYRASWYYMWRWGAYFPYGTYQGDYWRQEPGYLHAAHTSSVKDNFQRVDLGITLKPLPHLTIQAAYTINRDNAIRHESGGPVTVWDFWSSGTPLHDVASASDHGVFYATSRNKVNTFNGFATYDNTFADAHHIKLMAGINAEDYENLGFQANRLGLLDADKGELGLAVGDQTNDGYHDHSAYAGYFGRINYDYKDKYLLEVNGRYDGSSAFSPFDRWAFFSSGSVGYRISKEPFMKFIKPLVSDLKFRASLGTIGNLNVGGQYYIPLMYSIPHASGPEIDPVNWIVDGIRVPSFTNPLAVAKSLTWEKIKTLDFGVDISLFNDDINASFDWYQRTNTGMLSTNTVAATFGASAPRTNQGNMRDRGWEISINGRHEISSDWSIYAILSLNNNKAVITKWRNPSKLINNYYSGAVYGDIWGFVTDRYFTSDEDVAKSPSQKALENGNFTYGPGDIKYKDLNGDGKIDGGASSATDHGDLTVIGNTQPHYLYGARIGTVWKNLDVDIFIQGVGKRSYWGVGDMIIPYYRGGDITYAHQTDYWTPENTDARYPNPYVGNRNGTIAGLEFGANNFYPQTKYLMNLAYCRLKNVTIGYTLSSALIEKIHLKRLRVYVSGYNLAEIADVGYPLDPEITDGQSGFTGRTFPFQRNYSFGVQVTF